MSGNVKVSKRSALTWDPEFRLRVKDLEEHLERLTKGGMSIANKTVFMLCLAVGFEMQKTRPRPPRRSDAVVLSYLNDQDKALMSAIALAHTKDHTVLMDEDKVFDIIEEYAAGGLEVLVTQMETGPDFNNYLTKLLFTSLKDQKFS
jgi:hypothetical protein